MARGRPTSYVNWKIKNAIKDVENILSVWAWRAARTQFAPAIKDRAPIYEGKPRKSISRSPGTLRRGIRAIKRTKWSVVHIPHPGLFVNYGVNVKKYQSTTKESKNRRDRLRRSGGIPGKLTRPTLFIQKGMDDVFAKAINMAKGII